jgi:uncharacterized SAM-binding protein YcdF (DUF218 family)
MNLINTVIIVLGSPNDDEGNLSPTAISRCQQAKLEFDKNNNVQILCTGGFGASFNTTTKPHGFYTKQYLMNKGIIESVFLPIVESRFTLEDARLSKTVLEQENITEVILVTSDFHMARAKLVFNYVFPKINFTYSPAVTLLPAVDLIRLRDHEKKAILRELENIK